MGTSYALRSSARRTALTLLKSCGAFRLIEASSWRRQRLLILCYHGISLEDEHEWRPALYLRPAQFERRLEILRRGNYAVLPLGEALDRLRNGELPPRSVAITFDDGTYDFYRQAHPRLKQFGFPATVYLTSYYSALPCPVFKLICSYMIWKVRGPGTVDLRELGVNQPVPMQSTQAREEAANEIVKWADGQDLKGVQKDAIAARLAELLKVDYKELVGKRILQLINAQEVRELANAGVDFQLHTHRHRTPRNEELFRREIRDNRERIAETIPGARRHFCYPSGVYRPEFLQWLAEEGIVSATTCDTGMATVHSNPLLLPRLVDTTGRSELEFESWINGVGHFLSSKKRATPVVGVD